MIVGQSNQSPKREFCRHQRCAKRGQDFDSIFYRPLSKGSFFGACIWQVQDRVVEIRLDNLLYFIIAFYFLPTEQNVGNS